VGREVMPFMIKKKNTELFVGVAANEFVLIKKNCTTCKAGPLKFYDKSSAVSFFRYMSVAHKAKTEEYELHEER
jgi:hypothetical protein